MTNTTGKVEVTANDRDYTLWLGFSVLADLQDKHGQDVIARLDPPADAGDNWMPDLGIVRDLFLGALQRYHGEEADRWLVDDILAQNGGAINRLIQAAFPDADEGAPKGNRKRPKRAA